ATVARLDSLVFPGAARQSGLIARYFRSTHRAPPQPLGQVLAGVSSLGTFSDYVVIELRGRLGAGRIIVALEQADADQAAPLVGRQPERNPNIAAHMAVAGEQYHAPLDVRADRPRHNNVARHLRAHPRRQCLGRKEIAVTDGDSG